MLFRVLLVTFARLLKRILMLTLCSVRSKGGKSLVLDGKRMY